MKKLLSFILIIGILLLAGCSTPDSSGSSSPSGSDIPDSSATVGKVFARADIAREGTASDIDLGDYLLQQNAVSEEEYAKKQEEAKLLTKV